MGRKHTEKVTLKRKEKKRIQLKKAANSNLVAKKKSEDVPALRQRAGITVVDAEDEMIPSCPHGPCLLFTDGHDKWFGCAVYRSEELCKYKVFVAKDSKFELKNAKPINFQYGDGILSKIKAGDKFKNNSLYWCSKCCSYVTIPHRDPVEGPIKTSQISQKPSELLSASKMNKGSAQYWFTPEVLNVLGNVLEKFDSILCIGCPRVFEELWNTTKNAFLLDLDHRLSNFYSTEHFAHYSLLSNHFYQETGEQCLKKFFKKSKRLAILVDPPFGVILSPLEKSLNQLKRLFSSASPKGHTAQIVFLPVFMGKYLHGMSIVDYKVTYANHAQFKHKNKTIVRMFTDMDRKLFKLPKNEGYKPCKICERYVSSENQHCEACNSCTTTFGPTFKHCDKCEKCVKPQYIHCTKCKRCHLPNRCIA